VKITNPKAEPIEVVLQDGKFAAIRRPSRRDFVEMAIRAKGDANMLMPNLVSLLVTIDGDAMTVDEWLDSDFEATAPIANVIESLLKKASDNKGVA
jgi:hypothetical protein